MKIGGYLDHLAEWASDDREHFLRPLFAMLSPVSLQTLKQHQVEHFAKDKADYAAFVTTQNEEIVKCLHLELACVGTIVREECGLEPLTLDTDVAIPPRP